METRVKQADQQAISVELLKFVDSLVQDATEEIMALVKASKSLLVVDAHSLMAVSELLTMIHDRCSEVQNNVSWQAEACGANYTDDERNALSERLCAQHHALRAAKEVAHG